MGTAHVNQSRLTARSLARGAFRWTVRGLAFFGALVALYWLTLDLSTIVSPSMSPTLQGTCIDDGDRVLTEKISYRFRSPRRWEVVTFLNSAGEKRMKRVVGLPGERVDVSVGRDAGVRSKLVSRSWPAVMGQLTATVSRAYAESAPSETRRP